MRWLEEDGHVSAFRAPSNYSNGNTFDFEGRQLSCEHDTRRVTRWEHDGSLTALADSWNGKPLNAPNDIVVHPDGGIWFTDPGYGSMSNYEGHKHDLQLKEAIYRIDPNTLKMQVVTMKVQNRTGLCFSPDYKLLYVADTGGPEPRGIMLRVVESKQLRKRKRFCSMEYDGKKGGSDGIRADVDGNIWSAAGWAEEGYDGVHIFAPDGTRIGLIVLPENLRDPLFREAKKGIVYSMQPASQFIQFTWMQKVAHIT